MEKNRVDTIGLQDLQTQRRTTCLLILVGVFFLVLVGRLFWLQVIKSQELQEKAQSQWMRTRQITPDRGKITDRNGRVLAQSIVCETVLLRPRQITDGDLVADALSAILGMPRDYIIQRTVKDGKVFEHVLKRQVTEEQADAIRALNYKGVVLAPDRKRAYPEGEAYGRLMGYTSIDGLGQDGIELMFDKLLEGKMGYLTAETSPSGEELPYGDDTYVPPIPGLNVRLTIDDELQAFAMQCAQEAMAHYEPKYAGILVMDTRDGSILANAVTPTMNVNQPPRDDLALLRSLSRNPMIQDNYDPGSTFKIVTVAAALMEGLTTPEEEFTCNGGRTIDGVHIGCWKRDGSHGTQTLKMAVRNSCNSCFMDLALRLGKERFYHYLQLFGFGQITGIDFPGEARGIIQPIQYVTNVDLACMGFGQSISTTPLQLLRAFSICVNGGTAVSPHLLHSVTDQEGTLVTETYTGPGERIISEQVSAVLRDILEFTVRDGAKGAYVPGYRVGGKTGTSQKFEDGKLIQGRHVASFVGFVQGNDPRFAVLVIVDEPQTDVDYGAVVAAPLAGQFLAKAVEQLKIPKDPLPGEETVLQTTVVPDVVGMSAEAAMAALTEAGLEGFATGDGAILSQFPEAGAIVYTKTAVRLTNTTPWAQDGRQAVVPDLYGMSLSEAYSLCATRGLVLKVYGSGLIISQDLVAGAIVPQGTQVTAQFSAPPATPSQ